MTVLAPHPAAALEYWFFKVNSGSTALLVDWIARRRANEHVLRVSIHSPYKREVLFEKLMTPMTDHNFLKPHQTIGQIGEVAWELTIDLNGKWIAPDIFPARRLRMTDLSIVSAPLAVFSGWIRHGDQQVTLQNAPGMVSQYWGRQLASEWWWLSANQFDQPDFAVECSIVRSKLWGRPPQIRFAYLYLRQQSKQALVMAPFGLAQVKGSPEQFEITIRRLGAAPITLIGTGREYGDLGDNIINTLVGDLEIREGDKLLARALATAGLERRHPSSAVSG